MSKNNGISKKKQRTHNSYELNIKKGHCVIFPHIQTTATMAEHLLFLKLVSFIVVAAMHH